MVRLEQAIIMDREAQSSDTSVFRKNLPKAGSYSAIDIGIRITNGTTSAQGIAAFSMTSITTKKSSLRSASIILEVFRVITVGCVPGAIIVRTG